LQGRQVLAEHQSLLSKISEALPACLLPITSLLSGDRNRLRKAHRGGSLSLMPVATLAIAVRGATFSGRNCSMPFASSDRGQSPPDRCSAVVGRRHRTLQFMPSTFYSYAVDYNGDDGSTFWNNLEDVFASAANYLSPVRMGTGSALGLGSQPGRRISIGLWQAWPTGNLLRSGKAGVATCGEENVKKQLRWLGSVVHRTGKTAGPLWPRKLPRHLSVEPLPPLPWSQWSACRPASPPVT